ncbi:hypothetical protein [Streptomyces rubiginosohelvolus]|uniref:hypothetical protein n=1 Tax=Streptomyces rubiginosohelvolus TaxID=67362 RepID=UPI0033C66064
MYSRPCTTGPAAYPERRLGGRAANSSSARATRTRSSSGGTHARRNPSNPAGNGSHPSRPAITAFNHRTSRAYDTPIHCVRNGTPGGSPRRDVATDTHNASRDPSNPSTKPARTGNHRPNATRASAPNGNTTSTGSKWAPFCCRRTTRTDDNPSPKSCTRIPANSPARERVSNTTAVNANKRTRNSRLTSFDCPSHPVGTWPARSTMNRYMAASWAGDVVALGAGSGSTGNRTSLPGTTRSASNRRHPSTTFCVANGNRSPTSRARARSSPSTAKSQNEPIAAHVNSCSADLDARPGISSRPTARSNMPTTIRSCRIRASDTVLAMLSTTAASCRTDTASYCLGVTGVSCS